MFMSTDVLLIYLLVPSMIIPCFGGCSDVQRDGGGGGGTCQEAHYFWRNRGRDKTNLSS